MSPADIDPRFRQEHEELLSAQRGAGYWLWKPYFIDRLLKQLPLNDTLVYCDSAIVFMGSVQRLLDRMGQAEQDILIAGEGFTERQFTHREVFRLMHLDEPEYTDSPQRFASMLAFRVTAWSRDFAGQWLSFARDPRLISDPADSLGTANDPEFVDHRHDQSIFSLLSKRHRLEVNGAGLVCDGAEPTDECTFWHYRQLRSPAGVAALLLARNLLQPGDLAELV